MLIGTCGVSWIRGTSHVEGLAAPYMDRHLPNFLSMSNSASSVSVAGVYDSLLKIDSSEKDNEISRDLNRTYPTHVFYQQSEGIGQQSLYHVLKTYSVYDKKVSRHHYSTLTVGKYQLLLHVTLSCALSLTTCCKACGAVATICTYLFVCNSKCRDAM